MTSLSTIEAFIATTYTETGGDEFVVDSSNEIPRNNLVKDPTFRRVLGEADEMTLDLVPGSPWFEANNLSYRNRIKTTYSDASHEWWRIKELREISGEDSSRRFVCWPIWTDLASIYLRYQLQPTTVALYSLNLTNVTFDEALDIVFDPAYGCPDYFEKGDVDSGLASLTVSLNANASTLLDLIKSLLEQVQGEIEYRYTSTNCLFDFVVEAGLSAAEKADSNTPDPTKRPLHAPTGLQLASEGNRINLQISDAQEDFFTRLIPLAGTEEIQIGIAGMVWEVDSATDLSTHWGVDLIGDPVYINNCFNDDSAIFSDGTIKTIVDSVYPNRIVVSKTSFPTVPDYVTLYHQDTVSLLPSADTDLTYVRLPSAENSKGIVHRAVFFDGVVPYTNLFEEAGGSPDMSTGTGSGSSYLPDGIAKLGSPTVEEVSDAAYVNHGTKSIKVTAALGEGVETDDITLVSTLSQRYYSFWTGLRVASGKVRVSMIDAEGIEHPVGIDKLDFNSDTNQAVQSGGNLMSDGAAQLRIVALEEATVFYVDGITVTQSVGPYQLSLHMGPKALFQLGYELLLRDGGVQDPAIESELFDVSQYEASGYEEIRLGSTVEIKDRYDRTSNVFRLSLNARVMEIIEDTSPITGRLRKRVKLERRKAQFTDRVISAGKAPATDVAPPVPDSVNQTPDLSRVAQQYFLGTYSAAEIAAGIDVPLQAAAANIQITGAYVLIATTIAFDPTDYLTVTLKNYTQTVDLGELDTTTNDLTRLTVTYIALTPDAETVELDDVLYVALTGGGSGVDVEQLVIVLEAAGLDVVQATVGTDIFFVGDDDDHFYTMKGDFTAETDTGLDLTSYGIIDIARHQDSGYIYGLGSDGRVHSWKDDGTDFTEEVFDSGFSDLTLINIDNVSDHIVLSRHEVTFANKRTYWYTLGGTAVKNLENRWGAGVLESTFIVNGGSGYAYLDKTAVGIEELYRMDMSTGTTVHMQDSSYNDGRDWCMDEIGNVIYHVSGTKLTAWDPDTVSNGDAPDIISNEVTYLNSLSIDYFKNAGVGYVVGCGTDTIWSVAVASGTYTEDRSSVTARCLCTRRSYTS